MDFKAFACFALISGSCAVFAQMPDVNISADLRFSVTGGKRKTLIRMYDMFGRYSTISLNLNLETGYVVKAVERFAAFGSKQLDSPIEVAYLEAPGLWKAGIVDPVFGLNRLVREYGYGGEYQTFLVFNGLPLRMAWIDNGKDHQRGAFARVGERYGMSAAVGRFLAANTTSLTSIRLPGDSPGQGHGYQQIFGVDAVIPAGRYQLSMEAADFQKGEGLTDTDQVVTDLAIGERSPDARLKWTTGWAREWGKPRNHFYGEAELRVNKVSAIGVMARYEERRSLFGAVLHFKF